jgi:hypothetical protein
MRAIMKIGLALAFIGSITPCADARERDQSGNSANRPSRYFAREQIEAWRGEPFRIARIDTMDLFDAQRAMIENWVSAYPDKVREIQAAIRSNRGLSAALRSRNVQINNVVSVQSAFNGRLVFYLR